MTSEKEKVIRVGSRKSELALIQTKHVIARLQKLHPEKKFEIHTMTTIGDRVLNISLPKIGEKSLFTRDLEDALRNGGVDFVVHSLKDLPTALPDGMVIGAVLEREDARDALVLREEFNGCTLETLPAGSVIGTSSLRRTAQLRRQYNNLVVCDIRGNLNTRLAKLDAPDSKFSGIILAQAGLVRMGWQNRISQILEPSDLLYAVGQGALAIECRANDNELLDILKQLICLPTSCRILAERSFLKTLGGGCSAPVAVCSKFKENNDKESGLSLEGAVWSLDGNVELRKKLNCFGKFDFEKQSNLKKGIVDDCPEEPPSKRTRENDSDSMEIPPNSNPPVIDDDLNVLQIVEKFDIDKIIRTHVDLANKCPVVGNLQSDNNGNIKKNGNGASDAFNKNCPMHISVGQDVMGQCPFVNTAEQIITIGDGNKTVPINDVHANLTNVDGTMCSSSSSSKCETIGDVLNVNHSKCPFLQKTVQMFDYSDDEKPKPQELKIPLDLENIERLYCGLYQHKSINSDLFKKCQKLGQQLAEDLIKKGALNIMKIAQDEIHSKS